MFMNENAMAERDTRPLQQIEGNQKNKGNQKKEILADEKTFLAYTRTLLAWVRTSTSLLTFGFAIYKLLEQEASQPGDHPLLQVVNPKSVGIVMIFSGFLGLLLAVIGYIQFCRKYERTPAETFLHPAMLQSYVILALCALILMGALISGN
jgi:putative membrane protein